MVGASLHHICDIPACASYLRYHLPLPCIARIFALILHDDILSGDTTWIDMSGAAAIDMCEVRDCNKSCVGII